MHRDDYTGYIGSSAAIYFEDAASDLLIEVPRSMEQQAVWSPKARLFEIIKGPLAGDGDDVSAVMPRGVTADDILSVDVYTDTAYVDLSQNFKDACAGFSAKSEMRLVFSMVNTITAIDGINKVQFLVEGRQTQQLAGNLCLSDPFLRNYGIIKKTS
jgi:spore germination protein GerM